MNVTLEDYERARRDPVEFARVFIGQPLWPHQEEVVRSSARYRVINAGRRAGKTRVFGTLALHQGIAVRGSKVLIVSATDRSSKRMLADIAGMARGAELLRTSIDDESTSRLILTNGSEIECIPASMGAVRSAEADLLIVDEAGFVGQEIWEAAEPVVISRPGSRVLICSTPWGEIDHFFRALWTQGMDAPDEKVQAWHWPSSVSPLVDDELLADIRGRSSAEYFDREYLAVWGYVSGAYFASSDVDAAIDRRPLMRPSEAAGMAAVGGVDWGQARDASTLVVVVVDEAATYQRGRLLDEADRRPVYRVAFLLEEFGKPYRDVIDQVVDAAHGYTFRRIVSESNGVGAMPSEELHRSLWKSVEAANRRPGVGVLRGLPLMPEVPVTPLTTTSQTKADAFGLLRMLLQQRRLLLPDHPGLLKQLRALRFEQLPAGGVRISVPEAVGHDDLAMGLALCASHLLELERQFTRRQPAAAGSGTRWAHAARR